MIIPLEKRLKKRMHVEIALLQDEITELLYGIENDIILHGGTSVWRCYGGNRFSEDLDFYCANVKKIEHNFKKAAKSRGLSILKFKKTKNLIFCKVSNRNSEVRIEINFARLKTAISKPFEKTDGTFMEVLTLSPEELVLEKISAYQNRRFIRDIYDIYHLSNYVNDEKIGERMITFFASLEKPVDEENLNSIVYSGNVPAFKQIVAALKRRYS
ncbi:MAG: nucleotidyl transferase AbiEii/AbiGii toxin family protein [Candidatus Micrarchaeota archaeon]